MTTALEVLGFHCGSQLVPIWQRGRGRVLGSQSHSSFIEHLGEAAVAAVCPVLQELFTTDFHNNASWSVVVTTHAAPHPLSPKGVGFLRKKKYGKVLYAGWSRSVFMMESEKSGRRHQQSLAGRTHTRWGQLPQDRGAHLHHVPTPLADHF